MTTTAISLRLPMPPSANRLYRKFRNQVVLTSEARMYEEKAKKEVAGLLPQLTDFPVDLETMYRFDIILFLDEVENPGWFETFTKGKQAGERKAKERYKRIDIDNRVKFLQDCIVRSLGIPNDSQMFIGSQTKVKANEDGPSVFVTVRTVTALDILDWLQYIENLTTRRGT